MTHICTRPILLLIMGLPGAGKTRLADEVADALRYIGFGTTRLNGDLMRAAANDWSFDAEGRLRQARRMRQAALDAFAVGSAVVVMDFVAPLPTQRAIVAPDHVVWLDTVSASRFQNTNAVFVPPDGANIVLKWHARTNAIDVLESLAPPLNGLLAHA